jgi:disulfide oxidoreductase YuzD
MKKCKICGAALDGVMGKVRKLFFNQYPSDEVSDICNRCITSVTSKETKHKLEKSDTKKDEKYQCPVCKRMIHQSHALEHIKSEEYLMKLIAKDHPKWGKEEPICKECIDYYRKLVEDAEI